ncbi:MAG: flagellar biosynthetic protein FliP [Proteobacteria bacterium]|nr:MAG: flagellar biosynthetic protein FliP [Pseudomonadota bacterium]
MLAASAGAEEVVKQGALPDLSINIGGSDLSTDGTVSSTLKIVFLLTALTFAPAMVLTMTCFTRIAVVLGMTRTALGTQSLPPNMVITGLALFLTVAIMQPVYTEMYSAGIAPYLEGQMGDKEALDKSLAPLKGFLLRHARDKDIALFLEITRSEVPEEEKDIPMTVAVPAFILSELNLAFQIGFLIALPFLVLDMVVSSVLTSMSMITLPPVVISLPLKLMLFVVVDGWHLIVNSVVQTYHVGGG